jgi:multisubunit Na+/H+ antiporter MnhC subunit
MSYAGFFLIFVGIIVIAAPELIAYFVGTILIFAGANLLLLSYGVRKTSPKNDASVFRFGSYEIFRNRK